MGIRWYCNSSFEGSYYAKRFYRYGFFGEETDEINVFRWTAGEFSIDVPVRLLNNDDAKLKIFVRKNPGIENQHLDISFNGFDTIRIDLRDNKIFYELDIPAAAVEKKSHFIIQNAGSGYDRKYNGFDIGSGEIDSSQYDTPCEVPMFCGGGCLLTTEALKKTGLFNGNYFSYYEDSDLSMRLQKYGYKIMYNPGSVVMHYHAGTSKEWSPFFTYHVFRNKIIFAYKNFGVGAFYSAFGERFRETWHYLKSNVKTRFTNAVLRSRLKLNLVILKDSIIGILKYKPNRL